MQPEQNHFSKMKSVILSPSTFFSGLSGTEGFQKPIIFVIINTVISFILALLVSVVTTGKSQILLGLLGLVVIIPLVIIILFIVAAILHLIAKIFGGKARFTGSFQVLSYTTSLAPFSVIPILNFLVPFYQIYVLVVGFKKVHQYSTLRAVITILLPTLVLVLIAGTILLVAGLAAFGFLKTSGIKPNELQNLKNIQNTEDLQKYYPTFAPQQQSDYPTGFQDYSDTSEITE